MVLFNHSTRELTAKIVYYGPGLCGKTTNLRLLHEKLDTGTTGRLLSLSTAQDRTIYFDLLPVELGNVKGYTVRFQLCTVPGQVFYNETRKLVLKGVDGVVFVVDSQWSMLSHNLESFQNLRENMTELGQSLDETAVVIQYNKRDLPGVLSVQALQESLGFQEYPFVESVAADAKGVVETFKLVSKMTFVQLLKRLQRSPDGERLGPDWVSASPADSHATARIPAVGAQLLALTSTVGPAPAPPTESPFETTGSWPGLEKGEVFGDSTIPPFLVDPAGLSDASPAPGAAPYGEDTLTEKPSPLPPPLAEAEPEPLPELSLGPAAEPDRFLEPAPATGPPFGGPGPVAGPEHLVEPRPVTRPGPSAVPSSSVQPAASGWAPEAARRPEAGLATRVLPELESELKTPPPPLPIAPAPPPVPLAPEPPSRPVASEAPHPPPASHLPPPPPAATVWAEAFAGLSSRIEEMARIQAEESARLEGLARETRGAIDAFPVAVREAVAALAPAVAVAGVGEALEARVADLRASLEGRLASLEAALAKLETSDRLEDVRRETADVKRLVESKLEEAGGQSRRLSGFLRRALEELEPPDKP